jgi:two-component system sensor histidine kinase UhpB
VKCAAPFSGAAHSPFQRMQTKPDGMLPMSLRTQLLVSITLLLLFIVAVGGVFTYLHALRKVETEMGAAIAVGTRVARNAVDDVEETANPRRRLELLVADFNGDRHVRALLVNGDGTILLASRLEPPQERVPQWFYRMFAGEPATVAVKLPAAFDGLGALMLQTDSHNEVYEVWTDVQLMLAILTGFCALTSALVYLALGRALGPLDQLYTAFSRIGGGSEVPRLAETGPVELARVYRGFNGMVERLQLTEAQNKRLHEQLVTVQEEERADIARDLHDEIGPFLFSVEVDAAAIRHLRERWIHDEIGPRIIRIQEAISHMQKHVKGILGRLKPAAVEELGLAHAVGNLAAFWQSRQPSLLFRIEVCEESFGETLDTTVYRLIQESLSNAIRHGSPSVIEIVVDKADGCVLAVRVQDDGGGLPEAPSGAGFGITGMKERVAALGGSLSVRNRFDCRGTIVVAHLPISDVLQTDPPIGVRA